MDQDCWFHIFSFLYPTDLINLYKTHNHDFCDLVVSFFQTKPLNSFTLRFLISICSDFSFSSDSSDIDSTQILESKSVPGLSFYLKKSNSGASIGFNKKFLSFDIFNIIPTLNPKNYLAEYHGADEAYFVLINRFITSCFKFNKKSLKWYSLSAINLDYIKKSFGSWRCSSDFDCYLLNDNVFLNINLNDNIVRCQYFSALDSHEMYDLNRTFCFPFVINDVSSFYGYSFFSDSIVASINSPLVLNINRKFHLFWPLLNLFVSFDCIFEHMYHSIVFIDALNLRKNQKCFFITKCDNVLYSIGTDLNVYQHGQVNTPIEFISDNVVFSDSKFSHLNYFVTKDFSVSKINIISF
jgi:hypothetical protein